jgi:cardiolipin synthase
MNLLHWILITFSLLLSVGSAGHALLYKRDSRAALGWMAVCMMFPVTGPLLYFIFGINRVHTRARKLALYSPFHIDFNYDRSEEENGVQSCHIEVPTELVEIARMSDAVSRRPLVGGNRIEMLHNGEETYPAMLEAIENAENYLFLSTYIFESNKTGRQFIDALARATKRGVDVKVIIDGIGEFYSIPRASILLKRKKVRTVRFLPPKLIPPMLHINLRNHRKILVADGVLGFVGGMNIGDRHLAKALENPNRVVDVHFRLTGPVVAQLEQVFLEDWRFSTGEHTMLTPKGYNDDGGAVCRTIVDGPNEDIDKLAMILVGVVSSARRCVSIMTPYFLPSHELIAAMQATALRGVEVNVILPAKNNLPYVHWASRNMLWELLQRGVRIHYQPPPFVHTKLLIVDDHYAQIGSANIDPRSLRLNFEIAVEVYDRAFSQLLASHFQETLKRSHEITLREVDTRPLLIRTRDALAWLFTPYL